MTTGKEAWALEVGRPRNPRAGPEPTYHSARVLLDQKRVATLDHGGERGAGRLSPTPAPDPARLRKLVKDLDNDSFRIREKAAKELQELGHAAAPALRKALENKPTSEGARLIEKLLARKPEVGSRPELLRRLRAMQVLERIDSKEAREVLAELGAGLPLAAETGETQAALARLAR